MAEPYVYSNIVEAKLRAESIFANLFNNAKVGSAVAGAVKVPYRADATVGNYATSGSASLSTPTTNYITVNCDKDMYVNELIDGFTAATVADGLVADRLDSAAFALADQVDTDLITLIATSGKHTASGFSGTLSKSTVYGAIVDDIQTAKAAKVNPRKMWVAVSCSILGWLTKSDEFTKAAGSVAELGAGYRGMIAGIPVYETANLSGDHWIVGNSDFCHFVADWMVPVAVNDLADGAHIGCSAVQGREVYGCEISKPATVIYY